MVTNAPDIALLLLGRDGIEVSLVGGRLEPRAAAVLGAQALESLAAYRFDICFAGTCAIDADGNAWAVEAEEAAFKRALLRCADRLVVVASTEKLGAVAAHRIARHDQVDLLVVEADAPAAMLERLRQRGLDIVHGAPVLP